MLFVVPPFTEKSDSDEIDCLFLCLLRFFTVGEAYAMLLDARRFLHSCTMRSLQCLWQFMPQSENIKTSFVMVSYCLVIRSLLATVRRFALSYL